MDRDLMLLWVIIVGDKLVTFSCGKKNKLPVIRAVQGGFLLFSYVQPFSSQQYP